jgi:hypothetical protein
MAVSLECESTGVGEDQRVQICRRSRGEQIRFHSTRGSREVNRAEKPDKIKLQGFLVHCAQLEETELKLSGGWFCKIRHQEANDVAD